MSQVFVCRGCLVPVLVVLHVFKLQAFGLEHVQGFLRAIHYSSDYWLPEQTVLLSIKMCVLTSLLYSPLNGTSGFFFLLELCP